MARIRTIKPDLFRHWELYQAEQESGLPLRLAFIGLWTAVDREGRFKWAPNALKLDCLPYDQVDMAEVLGSLEAGGWLTCYEVDGTRYGCIPSWSKHQVINHREAASTIPPVSEENKIKPFLPGRAQACPGKPGGKGREGKGMEGNGNGREDPSVPSEPQERHASRPPDVAYAIWATVFLEVRGVPYGSKKADFIQLAGLRKRFSLNGKGLPPSWDKACRNYLSSPLAAYTLADLSSRYDIFVNGEVDRFGRPVGFSDSHQGNRATLKNLQSKGFFDEQQ